MFVSDHWVCIIDPGNPFLIFQMSTRRGSTEVHEFDGKFLGLHSHIKVTSVIGHVFRSVSVFFFLVMAFLLFVYAIICTLLSVILAS